MSLVCFGIITLLTGCVGKYECVQGCLLTDAAGFLGIGVHNIQHMYLKWERCVCSHSCIIESYTVYYVGRAKIR